MEPNSLQARPAHGALGFAADDADPIPGNARARRIAAWTLAVGFFGFLLWAAFAPLDEGVAAPGVVAIDTKRKPVQHLTGGIVKEVLVGEGQRVREGDVLMRLDEAVARANFEATRQHYLSLRAVHARLLAEQAGTSKISWHPDLQAASSDPVIRAQMRTQEQLLAARRGSLAADLQGIDESIQGQTALIKSYEGMQGSRKRQLASLGEELKNTTGLVAEGYAPRNRQHELDRSVAEANSSLAELQGNMDRAQRTIAELRQRASARQQEYRKEVETQMAEVSREVQSDAEKYRALQNDLARVEIRAPASGQVVGLSAQAVGGVIQSGQKLMDIVPSSEQLMLEAHVQPHLIDRIGAGSPVDIRFSAFAHTPSLVVDGRIASVSGDLITDPATNVSYYLARVAVTPAGIKTLGERRMQPGMPVEVIVRTGERSLLTYLLGPLTKRLAAAMKEE